MPGASIDLEARVAELVAQGHNPAAAVAIATSKQSREHKIHMIDQAFKGPKPKPKTPGRKKG